MLGSLLRYKTFAASATTTGCDLATLKKMEKTGNDNEKLPKTKKLAIASLVGCGRTFRRTGPPPPASPRCATIWLYLAKRSELQGAAVFICPVQSPTTRSAIKVSSVSPDLCETMVPQPFSLAIN
jgi:hypothetical protein